MINPIRLTDQCSAKDRPSALSAALANSSGRAKSAA